jgi:hypothetical protein
MELYGEQLAPLLEMLVERGGLAGVGPDGSFHERALPREPPRVVRVRRAPELVVS